MTVVYFKSVYQTGQFTDENEKIIQINKVIDK